MPLLPLKPSPWVAVAVVLVMTLCCQQALALYTFSCDGQMLKLRCSSGTVMHVRSAMFGKKPGSNFRCGETARVLRPCEADITQYIRYRCQGQVYCQVPVELATFQLETLCPEFLKYAEVHFDCVPSMALQGYQNCVSQCLPSPTYSYYSSASSQRPQGMGMGGGMVPFGSGNNAVVAGPQVGAPSVQPGVIYSHQGGNPVHSLSASSSSSSSSSPSSFQPSGGMGGGRLQHQSKGFGSPPGAGSPPQPAGPQGPQGPSVMQVVRNHMNAAKNGAHGHNRHLPPGGPHGRDALIAKVGQMLGAARRGQPPMGRHPQGPQGPHGPHGPHGPQPMRGPPRPMGRAPPPPPPHMRGRHPPMRRPQQPMRQRVAPEPQQVEPPQVEAPQREPPPPPLTDLII